MLQTPLNFPVSYN